MDPGSDTRAEAYQGSQELEDEAEAIDATVTNIVVRTKATIEELDRTQEVIEKARDAIAVGDTKSAFKLLNDWMESDS